MKKIKSLVILCLSLIIVACSTDSDAIQETNNFIESNKTGNSDFNFNIAINNVMQRIQEDPDFSLPLDQKTLDELLKTSGIEETMEVEYVNKMIEEIIAAQELGLKAYMDQKTELKEYTKASVIKMVESGYIKGIEDTKEFKKLPLLDQNVLIMNNKLVLDLEIGSGVKRFGRGEMAAVGVVVGASSGFAICGPLCGLVGGAIGGTVGFIVGIIREK